MSNAADSVVAPPEPPVGEPLLVTRELVKRYRGAATAALNGLSVTVGRGEVLGLLGPNGAGKTTAISIMSTLLRASSGTVEIAGLDVARRSRQVRRLIGLVPQEIALYPSLTLTENLNYFGRLYRLGGAQLRERIAACLELVGLSGSAHRPVGSFSGGMKRRANLAVGILHQPQLLFLDEPTVGIDAQSRNLILERLAELNRAGMTMIYTTHYMEEAQQLCTDLAIIDAGQVIAAGRPRQLLADGYANLEELFLQLTGRHLRD